MAFSLGDRFEEQREREWRRSGVAEKDIELSRVSGMDAQDVATFRNATLAHSLCIFIRCPKPAARVWHGYMPAKTWATKQKTNDAGVVSSDRGHLMVSDYDLMSVWRWADNAYTKVFMSAAKGAAHGPMSREAVTLLRILNRQLVSRLQHGCQDDFESAMNPGVKPHDHFMVFDCGAAEHLADPIECERYYRHAGLTWPYLAGKFVGKIHGKA